MRRRQAGPWLGLALILLALPAPAPAGSIAAREVLPNGLVLLVAERPAVPVVAVRVFLPAGAVHDPPDRGGLANLTAATLTRGTARRSGPQLDAAIEFVGGSLEAGAEHDGMTVALSVLRKDLSLGLDLLAEVLRTPAFPEAEVQRQAREIQAAIQRSEESPDVVAARALARLVFGAHPYGRPAEGTRESVGRLTRADVVDFHARHARPDGAVIAVVGAITREEARREVLARLGGWSAPPGPRPAVPAPAPGGPPRTEHVTRELAQATWLAGRLAVRQTHPDYFPLLVAVQVLGGGSASRLYDRVREREGLAYSVWSHVAAGHHGASLAVGVQTRAGEAPRAATVVAEELARMGREPVSERELSLARSYLVGSFVLRLDTSAKVASFITAVEAAGLGLDYGDRYRREVARVTAADVQRVAAAYLAPDGLDRVLVGPRP